MRDGQLLLDLCRRSFGGKQANVAGDAACLFHGWHGDAAE
jgi:hypothetical protein